MVEVAQSVLWVAGAVLAVLLALESLRNFLTKKG